MKSRILYTTILATMLSLPAYAVTSRGWEIPMIDTSASAENSGNVPYITGGVGDDERMDIEAQRSDYNVHILSAATSGAFVEETRVIVRKQMGREWEQLLDVNAGPLLYIQLDPGNYVVDAIHRGETKQQRFTIGKMKNRNVNFSWKVPAMTADE